MDLITDQEQLYGLARTYGLRPDWHEPDEQGITARVYGDSFDNAMPPGAWVAKSYGDGVPHAELHVVLYQDDDDGPKALACVNLATLFSWAAQKPREESKVAMVERVRIVQEVGRFANKISAPGGPVADAAAAIVREVGAVINDGRWQQ